MKFRSGRLITAAAFAGLVALLPLSGLRFHSGRVAARTAANNLATCKELARKIRALQSVPSQASLRGPTIQELALRIEQAAEVARMPASGLLRIDPQPNARLGDTAYLEQRTEIQLRQVTLRQLVTFLEEVTAGQLVYRVRSIRLSSARLPAVSDQDETWSADVVLSHLVFSPRNGVSSTRVRRRRAGVDRPLSSS